jgi:diguanylate cyclase (GGDEF)-like protein
MVAHEWDRRSQRRSAGAGGDETFWLPLARFGQGASCAVDIHCEIGKEAPNACCAPASRRSWQARRRDGQGSAHGPAESGRADDASPASGRPRRRRPGLLIDLDDFKLVYDTLGHAAGDELPLRVSRAMAVIAGPHDLVARQGGDEFVFVSLDADDADARAVELLGAITRPVSLRGIEISVGASIGIASWPADGRDAAALLDSADAAMYEAKRTGRTRSPAHIRLRLVIAIGIARPWVSRRRCRRRSGESWSCIGSLWSTSRISA